MLEVVFHLRVAGFLFALLVILEGESYRMEDLKT
jgi:hypothetical protein